MEEFGRKIQLQALQEGWTLEQYNAAKANYFAGIDPKELTTVYPPSLDPGFLAREGGTSVREIVAAWPGGAVKTAESFWNAVSSPFDTIDAIANGICGLALGFKDWITSPIPSHTLEKEFDKVATASAQELGGMAFDAVTGLLTAHIGGKAVEWVGGKWVAPIDQPKPTIELFGGKSAQNPGALNIDISGSIESGVRADARNLPLRDNSVREIVASNPFIPKGAGGTFSMMDFLPEATRVVEPGGKIFINTNSANPYGKLPSAADLESVGVRVIQDGGLDARFSGYTFLRTDGSKITDLHSMKTIVLEKIK